MPNRTFNDQALQLAKLKVLLQDQPHETPHRLALIKIQPSGRLELVCERMHAPASCTVLRRRGNWTHCIRVLNYARGPSEEQLIINFAATWHEVLLAQSDHVDTYVAIRADQLGYVMLATTQAA